jgi:Cu2+-exporting ATPase
MSGTEASSLYEKVRCDHCLQETRRQSALTVTVDGKTKYFCCNGCLGVYELIRSRSLDAFYRKRCEWQPGTPSFVKAEPASFRDSVVPEGANNRIDLLLSGIRCASCVWLVEKMLSRVKGVVSVRVNYATHRASIVWHAETVTLERILDLLCSLGYIPRPGRQTSGMQAFVREKQDLLLRFGTAAFFSMQLMLFTAALYAGFFQGMESQYRTGFQLISLVLATPVVFYSGFPFLASAARSLRSRALNMDVLVALGALSAYCYSVAMITAGGEVFFDTSSMIITFVLLGRFLEAGSRLKAGNALAVLAELQPAEALLIPGEGEPVVVPLDRIRPGDLIDILPGDRVPLDGTVTSGEAEVDESLLTGESGPVMKSAESEVFAGTCSINGRLRVRVRGNASDTLLSRIIRTVEDAQARKAPIQCIADRTAGYFVPAILFLGMCTFLFRIMVEGSTITSLMNAVSVLVIACPCALGLATPLAILVGTTSAGRNGILVKGGDVFESVSKTTTVVLDKTGTITKGKPVITDFIDYGRTECFLRHCASLEQWSGHPIGKAITSSWTGEPFMVEDFLSLPGSGVSGTMNGLDWHAGSAAHLEKEGIAIADGCRKTADSLEQNGKTVVYVAAGNTVAGLIGLIDDLREDTPGMVAALGKKGLRMMILTGDNEGVARYISERSGIGEFQAGLDPLGKAAVIRELRKQGQTVMMIGDGINDAPALTEADVGVTFSHGSGIALESAGIAILNDDLGLVDVLIGSSTRCFSIIRQNLVWAFSYNLVAIPLAVSGMLHPIVSALLMAASSLIVVSNSLRLRTP